MASAQDSELPASLSMAPVELQLRIFSYACTDSGKTGCSLAHVSKYFRLLCRTTGLDIQSAALCGIRQMRMFLEMLTKREEDTRRVESLYLTSHNYDPEDEEESQSNDVGAENLALMLAILKTIAPRYLRILFINYAIPRRDQPIFRLIPYEFPSLVELSVNGPIYKNAFVHSSPAPKLKRLHILSYSGLPKDVGEHLTRLFPTLTHLRISDASHPTQGHKLQRFLYAYCLTQPEIPTRSSFVPAVSTSAAALLSTTDLSTLVPSTLHRVIIGCYAYYYAISAGHFGLLREIIEDQKAFGVREVEDVAWEEGDVKRVKKRTLLILTPHIYSDYLKYKKDYSDMLERFGEEWVERTTGDGEGCWTRGDVPESTCRMDWTIW